MRKPTPQSGDAAPRTSEHPPLADACRRDGGTGGGVAAEEVDARGRPVAARPRAESGGRELGWRCGDGRAGRHAVPRAWRWRGGVEGTGERCGGGADGGGDVEAGDVSLALWFSRASASGDGRRSARRGGLGVGARSGGAILAARAAPRSLSLPDPLASQPRKHPRGRDGGEYPSVQTGSPVWRGFFRSCDCGRSQSPSQPAQATKGIKKRLTARPGRGSWRIACWLARSAADNSPAVPAMPNQRVDTPRERALLATSPLRRPTVQMNQLKSKSKKIKSPDSTPAAPA